MDLAQLQHAFQNHVLEGDDAIAGAIDGTDAAPAPARLAVYASAYRLRLVDALAHNYPRLQQWLGADAFASIANEYLRVHPSTHASVRWFGDRLAGFLATRHSDRPALAELAQFEWALAAAFDAEDIDPVGGHALGGIDPAQWTGLRLQLHPSVRLLHMSTNAPAVFRALAADREPPVSETLPAPQGWCLWREGLTPKYRSVAADEAAALQTLLMQQTFAELCGALCEWHEDEDVPVRAVTLLKGWIRDSMIAGIVADRD